ncbi:hypothetical protein CLOP_g825 [Closterium sp. NIES-67]|nr:hypothetical protein CLOP_g825 [Closterium sp. NIES-67]
MSALPLVGMGGAYHRHGITTIGPAKTMPSGGFIYMDGRQLANDVAAGLIDLTLQQWQAIQQWVSDHSNAPAAILAVGDVFPLALAWLASNHSTTLPPPLNGSSRTGDLAKTPQGVSLSVPAALPFAFMGTAKSEFYIRGDDNQLLPSQAKSFVERWWHAGGVYHPWERWLMARPCCRLAVVRDRLTAQVLADHLPAEDPSSAPSNSSSFCSSSPSFSTAEADFSEQGLFRRGKVAYLGNPMMDDMAPSHRLSSFLRSQLPSWLRQHTSANDAANHTANGSQDSDHDTSSSQSTNVVRPQCSTSAHTTNAAAQATPLQSAATQSSPFRHALAIFPGSRVPEVFSNWELLTASIPHLVSSLASGSGVNSGDTNPNTSISAATSTNTTNIASSTSIGPLPVLFLCPIVPSLPPSPFSTALLAQGWRPLRPGRPSWEGEGGEAKGGRRRRSGWRWVKGARCTGWRSAFREGRRREEIVGRGVAVLLL